MPVLRHATRERQVIEKSAFSALLLLTDVSVVSPAYKFSQMYRRHFQSLGGSRSADQGKLSRSSVDQLKVDFHHTIHFHSFPAHIGRLELPLADAFHRRLCQKRIARHHVQALHRPAAVHHNM